ncbi:MAG: ABC transporter ATP-binding protein [Candidatus Dormiibacterota bacterium]
MSLLEVRSVDAQYGLLKAVRGVSLTIDEGETRALVGANGAGKTTLLSVIAGAHRPAAGTIIFDGVDITRVPAHKRVGLGIALVPEGRRLFPGLSVEENLSIAGARRREGAWTVDRVFEIFPMLQPRRRQRAATLSGGEQQATAIGRALMCNPRLILLDEVSLGLAPMAVASVYDSLRGLISSGTTVVIVEQDLGRALTVSTRVTCMLHGEIVLEGKSSALTREQITAAYFGVRQPSNVGSEP